MEKTIKLRSKRFTSEKSANSFAKKVNGEVRDLRGHKESKSNFKVTYKPDPNRANGWWNDSYAEQWNEKNMDGSFAYNGVTEDF
jgi:hypothetical protein